MTKSNADAYSYLNNFIDKKIISPPTRSDSAFEIDKPVVISGKRYLLNCWQEKTSDGEIVCVELRRRKLFFFYEVYSLGVLLREGYRTKLNQEELWKMGF